MQIVSNVKSCFLGKIRKILSAELAMRVVKVNNKIVFFHMTQKLFHNKMASVPAFDSIF